MSSRWMQPKLDKMLRDGLARPTSYTLHGAVLSKADARLVALGAVKSCDHIKLCAETEKRRAYLDRNEPRYDRRTYGNFKRLPTAGQGYVNTVTEVGQAYLIAKK